MSRSRYTRGMNRLERAIVATSLAFSALALAFAFYAMPSSGAHATLRLPADLGPAEGLILTSADGKDTVRMEAKDGHIAWGDRSTNRVWSVASVDIDKVMKKVLEGASYVDKRKEAQEGAQAEEAAFNKRAEDIKAKYPLPTDGSQPPQEAQREFGMLQQEYNKWLEGVRTRDDKIAADQFEQAYRELVAAVETISEKESIDLVFRFFPTADPFKSERAGEALAQIQSRTFLKYPASIDITADVMKALNLTE